VLSFVGGKYLPFDGDVASTPLKSVYIYSGVGENKNDRAHEVVSIQSWWAKAVLGTGSKKTSHV
jgi:hypothetical protein